MFGHKKDEADKPKLSRKEKKSMKLEAKKEKVLMSKSDRKAKKIEKKQAKLANKDVKEGSFKKHITSLPFAGSRILQSFAGFAAAGTFYQYEAHDPKLMAILGGSTVAISLISAAPYMKSVARTNKTLSEVQSALSKVDSFVGANEQVASAVVADVEKVLQQKGYAPETIRQLSQKIDNLQRSIDAKSASPSNAPKSDIHTAPSTQPKKNVVAE